VIGDRKRILGRPSRIQVRTQERHRNSRDDVSLAIRPDIILFF